MRGIVGCFHPHTNTMGCVLDVVSGRISFRWIISTPHIAIGEGPSVQSLPSHEVVGGEGKVGVVFLVTYGL